MSNNLQTFRFQYLSFKTQLGQCLGSMGSNNYIYSRLINKCTSSVQYLWRANKSGSYIWKWLSLYIYRELVIVLLKGY